MKLHIHIEDVEREQALTRFIEHRIDEALGRHKAVIDRVEVRIRDINGTRGGLDMEAKLIAYTKIGNPLLSQAVRTEAGAAFRAASKQLIRNLRQSIERKQRPRKVTRKLVRATKRAA